MGHFEIWTTKLPSSAEEGKADAVAAAGVVLVKKIALALRARLRGLRLLRGFFLTAQPPLLG